MKQPSYDIRAVVFDLDGLMLNTEDVFEISGRELMHRRGRVMTQECHHRMLGRRPHEAFEIMKELLDLDEPIDVLFAESREIFSSLLEQHLAPMHGLFELLDHIEGCNLPKAVATSSPRVYMLDLLAMFELTGRFGVLLAAEDVTHGKPHPEIYQRAAKSLGIEPQQMLVLEDSEAGTQSAAAAGSIVVSVPNKHTQLQDFSTATHVAASLIDDTVLKCLGAA